MTFSGIKCSLHLGVPFAHANTGKVGDHLVAIPHFGLVLPYEAWRALADRLIAAKVPFMLEPSVRFPGEPSEQWTMFFTDPAGNLIEMKGFRDASQIFAKTR
ncbi:MAG: extradiol dioxygenase family protein [Paracoccaceae bacterium]